ncbi:MAG: aminodeoxychorismate lyase [Lachnospiraceae bacterium]|nr:aminodeoxychorismate lyase [Lachnospiraceae bacterium]
MREKKNDVGYRMALEGFQSMIHILVYILIVVLLILLGKRAYTIGYQVVNTDPVAEENGVDVTVTITDDMSVMEIGRLLDDWGLIDEEPVSFAIQEALSEYHDRLLPGTYVLNTGMSVDEMLQTMSASETEDQE